VSLARYSVLVAAATGLGLALAYGFGLRRLGPAAMAAACFGALLAAANTITAYLLVRWSEGRSTRAFMGAVLGGMVGRLLALLSSVAAGILLLDLPRSPLVVSLLSFFAAFLVFELAVVHRRTSAAAEAR
jgi:hypothetical protein